MGIIELTERIKMMGIKKEFYLDLSNSDNNILDLSEYKGQKVKVSVETEDIVDQNFLQFFGSIKWKDKESLEYQRDFRNEWK